MTFELLIRVGSESILIERERRGVCLLVVWDSNNTASAMVPFASGLTIECRSGLSAYETSKTAFPKTSIFGTTPRPGSRLAAINPFTRFGAPSAVLTVT